MDMCYDFAMEERRHFKRLVVEGIEGALMFATDVHILNISINGVALSANRRLEIGREYTLKLEYMDKSVSLAGVVVWSVLSELGAGQHGEKVPIYKAGMKFRNVISESMARLLEFIDEHKFAVDDRLTIRFNVRSPDRARLDGLHNYKVKKVSEKGMLIMTDIPLDVEERFPMEVFYGDNTIRFTGRVASCIEVTGEVPKHYDIGVEIVEISDDDRTRFNEFVETLRSTQSRHHL